MLYMTPLSIFKFTGQISTIRLSASRRQLPEEINVVNEVDSPKGKKNQTLYPFIRILTFPSDGIILVPTNQSYE